MIIVDVPTFNIILKVHFSVLSNIYCTSRHYTFDVNINNYLFLHSLCNINMSQFF